MVERGLHAARLRSRRSPLLFSKKPSRPIRHTVSSLLRAEKLLLLQAASVQSGAPNNIRVLRKTEGGPYELCTHSCMPACGCLLMPQGERRSGQEEASADEGDSKVLEVEEARRRVLRLKARAETARIKAIRAAADQRSRRAAAARSQRLKEAQWLAACRSSEKQRLLLHQEKQGTTIREARRRATLALQQLVISKRLMAETFKREREKMRRAASIASRESHLKRRVAASRLRGLVAASSVVARMRRAAAVDASKDATCSGPLQQLSLDSKCLLEVRLRAELLKRRAAETLQRKRDALLRAKAARAEALAEKAARVSDLLTTKQMEAAAQRQKRHERLRKLKESTLQRADMGALHAAAWVRSRHLRRHTAPAAAADIVAASDIVAAADVATAPAANVAAAAPAPDAGAAADIAATAYEAAAAADIATPADIAAAAEILAAADTAAAAAKLAAQGQQLMRGLERAALSRQLWRVAQQEVEERLLKQEQKQRRHLRETQRQAAAERRLAQQQAFDAAREDATAFLAEEARQKKERVAAMRAREGRQKSPSIAEGLIPPDLSQASAMYKRS
ncbi:hypothetical protein ACSSS7_005436 [Eimeria intestinalis]